MRVNRIRPRPAWLPLLMASAVLPAHAQVDSLQFSAGYQIQRDSNLFRLAPSTDPQVAVGQPTAADTLQIKRLGVRYAQDYSLQSVQASLSVVDYEYSRNSRYDLVATNYNLNWDWAVTPQLRGSLYADRNETVNNFEDADALASGKNRRLRTSHGVNFRYEQDAFWNLLGGVVVSEDRSDEDVTGNDDYRQASVEGGFRRNFGSGSHTTVRGRYTTGRNLTSTQLADNQFRQYDAQLDLRWVISALTVANASLTRLDRAYTGNHAFDYDGFNGSASVQWQPTGKLRLTFSGSSALSSYQTSASTHARTDRLGVQALWAYSPRTNVGTGISEARLRLLGHPGGGVASNRKDDTREVSVNANWAIDNLFTLSSSLVHRKRDSNVSSNDFSGTVFNVGLNADF